MAGTVNRFLGDSPGRTIVKLVVASLAVGFLMRVFHIEPMDIVDNVRFFFIDLWYTGFDAFGRFGSYFLLGATVVLPVFILIRILSYRR